MKDEMSRNFRAAFSAQSYDHDLAIRLYNLEISQIDPNNFSAWNNRGVCKVYKGIATKNKDLIQDGMTDFQKAIDLVTDGNGFPGAEDNLKWAAKELEKLS